MTSEIVAACCCGGGGELPCIQTNLLCHGEGIKSIRIFADSIYSSIARGWCELPPAAGYWHTGYQAFGECHVNLAGVYLSHRGDDPNPLAATGFNRISGTVEMSFTDIYYPDCEGLGQELTTYVFTVTGATFPNVDFSYTNFYGCGHLRASFDCTVSYTVNGIFQGSYQATWTIEGVLCDSCLNPTLQCYPYMVSGAWSNFNPSGTGINFNFSDVPWVNEYLDPGVTWATQSASGSFSLEVV